MPNIVFAQAEPICCVQFRADLKDITSIVYESYDDYEPIGCRLDIPQAPCQTSEKKVTECDGFIGPLDVLGSTLFKSWDGYRDYIGFINFDDKCIAGKYKEVKMKCTQGYNLCLKPIDYWRKNSGIGECHNKTDVASCVGGCFWSESQKFCFDPYSNNDCSRMIKEFDCTRSNVCKWDGTKCLDATQQFVQDTYGDRETGRFMPACTALGTCNSIGDIMEVPLRFAQEIFKYIGALAFVFFIFGGGVMILSFGNADKFAMGKRALVAAVIGLIIVFGAYFIISFILQLIGVSGDFTPLNP